MSEMVLMQGNEAIAEAAVRAGCRAYFGYPITPQTQIIEYLAKRMPEVEGVVLQAESEIAAINMVYGAAGAGARVMTSSSSPGISLKLEGLSYIAGAELPCLLVNVMRAGPGLGGILASQSDYFQATKGGGHGDYQCVVLAPSSVQECVDLVSLGFEIADRYRNPTMILADGLLGQMMEPVVLGEDQVSISPKPWATTGLHGRTVHNVINSLDTVPERLEMHNQRLAAKYAEMAEKEVRWETLGSSEPDIVLVAFGTVARIVRSAMDLALEQGIAVALVRPITVWPFPYAEVQRLAQTAKQLLVVEMNNGQMVEDVQLAAAGRSVSFYGRTGGMVPSVRDIFDRIVELHRGGGK